MQNKSIGSQSQCSNVQSDLTFKDYYPNVLAKHPENETHITNFKKETNQKPQKPNDSLNLIFFNARSILNKLSEHTEQINSGLSSQAPPHVITVTETWLNASVPDSCLTIPSFSQVFRTDRSSLSVSPDGHDNRRGGGVLLLVQESVKCRRRDDLQCWPESVWIELNLDQRKNKKTSYSSTIILGCVYRPPSMTHSDVENFTSLLEQSLERVNISKNMVVILGDFNATSPTWTCGVDQYNTAGKSLQPLALRYNLKQCTGSLLLGCHHNTNSSPSAPAYFLSEVSDKKYAGAEGEELVLLKQCVDFPTHI